MPPRFLLQNFRVRSGIFTFPGLEVVNLVDRYVLDFSLMLHANSPIRPTLISQGIGVSLTLTQREPLQVTPEPTAEEQNLAELEQNREAEPETSEV